MNGTQAAPATAETEGVRDVWWLRSAVRLHRWPMGAGDLHGLRRLRSALIPTYTKEVTHARRKLGLDRIEVLRPQRSPLACVQTGSPRGAGACLASGGGCAYCGLPAPAVEARLRLDALLDERAQYAAEAYR